MNLQKATCILETVPPKEKYLWAFLVRTASCLRMREVGIPGWRSCLAPAFGPGRNPGDPGSNPTSGSRCMEPASPSPSACVSASLSLWLSYHKKKKKKERKECERSGITRTARGRIWKFILTTEVPPSLIIHCFSILKISYHVSPLFYFQKKEWGFKMGGQ